MVRFGSTLIVGLCCLFLLSSCVKQDTESHFSAAQAALANEDDLPLALWHLQEYIALADKSAPNLTLARILLEKCKADLLQQLESSSHTSTRIQDLEIKVRLLEQQNTELTNWKERLVIENKSLRNALLQAQKSSSSSAKSQR